MLAAIRVRIGITLILTAHGVIQVQVQEVPGAILHSAIHHLVVPAAVDSPAVVDSLVVAVVVDMPVVADTEDDKIIRSSFYSI